MLNNSIDAIKNKAKDFSSSQYGQILNLVLSKEIDQKELDEKLSLIDIERLESSDALILAYVKKKNPSLSFDEYTGPRLDGILKYYRFSDLNQTSIFSELTKQLNALDFAPMVSYDAALKLISPENNRLKDSLGIFVQTRREYYDIKKKIQSLGYTVKSHIFSFDVYGKSSKDPRKLSVRREKIESYAIAVDNNTTFLMPSLEDLVYLNIMHIGYKLEKEDNFHGLLFDLFDLLSLLQKEELSFNKLEAIFASRHKASLYSLVSAFVNYLIPGILPGFGGEHK